MKSKGTVFFVFLISILFFSACDEPGKETNLEPTPDYSVKNEIPAVDDKDSLRIYLRNFLKDEQKPEEVFRIPFAKKTLKTAGGVKIFFNPEIFDTGDEVISTKDTLTLLFKDFYTRKDFVLNHLQTLSDEGMLISGGMFFIDVKYNGKILKIKDSTFLKVEFPVINKSEMNLYYKNKEDSIWLGGRQRLTVRKNYKTIKKQLAIPIDKMLEEIEETETDESGNVIENNKTAKLNERRKTKDAGKFEWKTNKQLVGYYYSLKLNNLGWFNCDRLYEIENKTDIYVEIERPETFKFVQSFLVFKSMNSVLEFMFDSSYGNELKNMPLGEKVKLIGLYADKNQLYYAEKEFVIRAGKIISLDLQKISKEDFQKKMRKL